MEQTNEFKTKPIRGSPVPPLPSIPGPAGSISPEETPGSTLSQEKEIQELKKMLMLKEQEMNQLRQGAATQQVHVQGQLQAAVETWQQGAAEAARQTQEAKLANARAEAIAQEAKMQSTEAAIEIRFAKERADKEVAIRKADLVKELNTGRLQQVVFLRAAETAVMEANARAQLLEQDLTRERLSRENSQRQIHYQHDVQSNNQVQQHEEAQIHFQEQIQI